jgi:hypothetical protein
LRRVRDATRSVKNRQENTRTKQAEQNEWRMWKRLPMARASATLARVDGLHC